MPSPRKPLALKSINGTTSGQNRKTSHSDDVGNGLLAFEHMITVNLVANPAKTQGTIRSTIPEVGFRW